MKNKKHVIGICGFCVIAVLGLFLTNQAKGANDSNNQPAPLVLSQEELANLTKPAVVRILQHVKGTVTIYPFDINFKDLTIFPVQKQEPVTIPIDEYFTGSGEIINPDGYILTNSHVVSYQSVKLIVAAKFGVAAITAKETSLSEDKRGEITKDEEKLVDFGKRIVEFLLEKSKFDLEKTVTVLNPSVQDEKKEDLIFHGFPAKIISVNDNFYNDNKDVAVIKINESNLPAMKMGNSDPVKTGEAIYIFGFPGTADFNSKNLLESTFSKGVVSAFKDSDNKDFKIIQTDAKVSQGSSGGPLLNAQGEIIGLITYQTGSLSEASGDNFAFAIPINNAKDFIKSGYISDATVEPADGDYSQHFQAGIAYLHNKECKKAIAEFGLVADVNSKFESGKNTQNYVDQCNAMIAAGQSIDTNWQKFWQRVKETNSFVWLLSGVGFIVFILLIIIIWFLSKKLKKDEKEIDVMEKHINAEEKEINQLEKIMTPTKENIIPNDIGNDIMPGNAFKNTENVKTLPIETNNAAKTRIEVKNEIASATENKVNPSPVPAAHTTSLPAAVIADLAPIPKKDNDVPGGISPSITFNESEKK